MRQLPYPAGFQSRWLDRYRSRRIQQVKGCGKTKDAIVIRGKLVPVGRRKGAAVSRVLAELR
jgi:phage protein U